MTTRSKPGPPPLPSAVKRARGTDRPDRGARNEPKPKVIAPTAPAATRKRPEAHACWKRLVPELVLMRCVAKVDREMVATYCDAWADFVWAVAEVARDGLTFTTDKGNVIQHPAVSIKNSAAERLRKLAQEFGLTPSARSRIEVEGDAEETNKQGPGRLLSKRSNLRAVPGG